MVGGRGDLNQRRLREALCPDAADLGLGVAPAGLDPLDELDGVDAPFPVLDLVDERVGPLQLYGEGAIGQPGGGAQVPELFAQPSVRGRVLGPCSHDGRTLRCPRRAPSLGADAGVAPAARREQ